MWKVAVLIVAIAGLNGEQRRTYSEVLCQAETPNAAIGAAEHYCGGSPNRLELGLAEFLKSNETQGAYGPDGPQIICVIGTPKEVPASDA